jgi:hypothetical protein
MNKLAYLLTVLLMTNSIIYADSSNDEIQGAANIIMLGYLQEWRPHSPGYVEQIKKTVTNNARKVNEYIIVFLDEDRFKEKAFEYCNVLAIIALTKEVDPDGARRLAKKYKNTLREIFESMISQATFPLELLTNPLHSAEDYERLPDDLRADPDRLTLLRRPIWLKRRINYVDEYLENVTFGVENHNLKQASSSADAPTGRLEPTLPSTPKKKGSLIYMILAAPLLIVLIFGLMIRKRKQIARRKK